MAERITIPAESAKCNWASGGGAYPSADPGAPARDAGFKPKDFPVPGAGAIVPAEDHNFLWRLGMEMLSWLRNYMVREWTDLYLGIAAANGARDLFRYTPPAGGIAQRLLEYFSAGSTATGGGNPIKVCTDGEMIYYIAGTTNVSIVAASPFALTQIWESIRAQTVSAIAADGLWVYYTSNNAADPGLSKLSRVDGVLDSNAGARFDHTLLKANGAYCAGIHPNGAAGDVDVWSVATPAYIGAGATGSASLAGMAIDADQCYVGGVRNTFDVWCYTLSAAGLVWQIALPTSAAPTIAAIAADGNYVYVATDSQALSAPWTGSASVFCLDRATGTLLWTIDAADTLDIAVDDQYLHVVFTTGVLIPFDLRRPIPGAVGSSAGWSSVDVDGISVVGGDSVTATNVKRAWLGYPTKTFMVALGNDEQRRPFHNLAVPVK